MRDGSLNAADPPSATRAIPRVSVFGDSTALYLAIGLLYQLEQEGLGTPGIGVAEPGCGILRPGVLRWKGRERARPDTCANRERAWANAIARGRPDVAVVSAGPWEVCDRKLRPDDRWRHLGDPILDEAVRREMLAAVDLLSKDGTLVIWLTSPEIDDRDHPRRYPESDPTRMARFNELVLELEALRPAAVRVADLAARAKRFPKGVLDRDYRPDGVHLSNAGSLRLAREWLASEILRLYREAAPRAGRATPTPAASRPRRSGAGCRRAARAPAPLWRRPARGPAPRRAGSGAGATGRRRRRPA
jgi:hypothetical protein